MEQTTKKNIKKPMIIMLIVLGVLFGAIFLYHIIISLIIKHAIATMKAPPVTVTTIKAADSPWQPHLVASGSLRAIYGVNVTTELAGMVRTIYFKPGAMVKKGTVLVQLNADPDIAQLHSLQAKEALAKITYDRNKKQLAVFGVSQQTVDNDYGDLTSLQAQVEEQAATVAKKTIRAPFSGRLGICLVSPGEYINNGAAVATLQTLDPIYADFYLPQQDVGQLKIGQAAKVTADSFPKVTFTGKITTINPLVDTNTRNVQVEATIANSHYQLLPGMFATVEINTGAPVNYLTLPQTAISFNPYGDIVYLVQESTEKDKKGNPILTVQQSFVTTGETRGDQITVLTGLKAGDTVVTSGQVKLSNGSHIIVDNSVQPSDSATPIKGNKKD